MIVFPTILFWVLSLQIVACLHIRAPECVFFSNCEHHDYQLVQRAEPHQKLTLRFAVKNKNIGQLYEILDKVSDPRSQDYGKYLNLQELSDLTTNQHAKTLVLDHLGRYVDQKQIRLSDLTNFIRVDTDVKTAERLLKGEFHMFHSQRADHEVLRMLEYELPDAVSQVLDWVTPTVDFPVSESAELLQELEPVFSDNQETRFVSERKINISDGYMVPEILKTYYNIPNKIVDNKNASQAVMTDTRKASVNPDDIPKFQKKFNLKEHAVDEILGNISLVGCDDPTNCRSANGALEWMLSIAQGAHTTFWGTEDAASPLPWLEAIASDPNPPLVHSISWLWQETHFHSSQLERLSEEIAKLGSRGITIVTSANWLGDCKGRVRVPPTIPYTLSVGTNMGPEWGEAERPRQSNVHNYSWSSVGGFSNHFPRPQYQNKVVEKYLSNNKIRSDPLFPPDTKFNALGRGYPDISMASSRYFVMVNGYGMGGSGFAPDVMTGVLTLANNERLNAGKPPLGFVNPALYQLYEEEPSIFKDITKGEGIYLLRSSPEVEPLSCDSGWIGAEGWDPLTGLGSPNVGKLIKALKKL